MAGAGAPYFAAYRSSKPARDAGSGAAYHAPGNWPEPLDGTAHSAGPRIARPRYARRNSGSTEAISASGSPVSASSSASNGGGGTLRLRRELGGLPPALGVRARARGADLGVDRPAAGWRSPEMSRIAALIGGHARAYWRMEGGGRPLRRGRLVQAQPTMARPKSLSGSRRGEPRRALRLRRADQAPRPAAPG